MKTLLLIGLIFQCGISACQSSSSLDREPIDPHLASEVKQVLQSVREEEPTLYVDRSHDLVSGKYVAYTEAHRILMAREGLPDFRFILTHELAHWYAVDSPYAGAPAFVLEGLAHWVACHFSDPDGSHVAYYRSSGRVTLNPEVLQPSLMSYLSVSLQDQDDAARVGFNVVDHLGLTRIKEMALAGAAPLEYLVAADLAPREVSR